MVNYHLSIFNEQFADLNNKNATNTIVGGSGKYKSDSISYALADLSSTKTTVYKKLLAAGQTFSMNTAAVDYPYIIIIQGDGKYYLGIAARIYLQWTLFAIANSFASNDLQISCADNTIYIKNNTSRALACAILGI